MKPIKIPNYAALARALKLERRRVWTWFQPGRRIPGERVLAVERATGISRYRLRPDLYPRERAR